MIHRFINDAYIQMDDGWIDRQTDREVDRQTYTDMIPGN